MTGPRNGSPVTWRELDLALDPLRHGLGELRDDVKKLLAESSEKRGQAAAAKDGAARWWAAVSLVIAVAAILVPVAVGHG